MLIFGQKSFDFVYLPWKLDNPYYHVCMFQVYHAKGGKVADGEKAKIKLTFSENTVKVKDFQLWNFRRSKQLPLFLVVCFCS